MLACSWDAWGTRDFGTVLIHMNESFKTTRDTNAVPRHDATSSSRRSLASLVPRGDIGSNIFGIYCSDWMALSPPRSRHWGHDDQTSTDDFMPCTVVVVVNVSASVCAQGDHLPQSIRFPMPPLFGGAQGNIIINIDGVDTVGSSTWWTPVDASSRHNTHRVPPPTTAVSLLAASRTVMEHALTTNVDAMLQLCSDMCDAFMCSCVAADFPQTMPSNAQEDLHEGRGAHKRVTDECNEEEDAAQLRISNAALRVELQSLRHTNESLRDEHAHSWNTSVVSHQRVVELESELDGALSALLSLKSQHRRLQQRSASRSQS
jgi:hypothetical protein